MIYDRCFSWLKFTPNRLELSRGISLSVEGVPCLFTVCFAVFICFEFRVQSRKQDHGFCVMGCSSSIGQRQPTLVNESPIDIPLSKAQKYLVRETWETVEPHKSNVGKQTFLRFFETNPEFQRLFPEFKNLKYEELQKANALHGHAKRVMKAVENAVSAMDDAVSFSAYLEELGRRHVSRSLKPSYLDAMQTALMDSMGAVLQSAWTDETAAAWNKLFRFVADTMISGLQSS